MKPYLVDYHLHSDSSLDCPIPMVEQCQSALELGLAEICFTEHLDFDPRDGLDGFLDEARYDQQMAEVRRKFATDMIIRQGVELGEGHRFHHQAEQRLAQRSYDFVLASVHWNKEICLGVPFTPNMGKAEFYDSYFYELLALSRFSFYDVMAHFDLAKRFGVQFFGPLVPEEYEEQIRLILRNLVENGKGIEINTSGLRQPPQETLPGMDILRWYHEAGGEILTFGSDSHRPYHVGYQIELAYDMARAAGFKAYTVFDQRRPIFKDL